MCEQVYRCSKCSTLITKQEYLKYGGLCEECFIEIIALESTEEIINE